MEYLLFRRDCHERPEEPSNPDPCHKRARTGYLHRFVQDRLTSQVSIGQVIFIDLYRTGYLHKSIKDRFLSQVYIGHVIHVHKSVKDRLPSHISIGQVTFTGLYVCTYRTGYLKKQ
jgi:hypothetical protein